MRIVTKSNQFIEPGLCANAPIEFEARERKSLNLLNQILFYTLTIMPSFLFTPLVLYSNYAQKIQHCTEISLMYYLSNKNVNLFNLICIEFSYKMKGKFEKLITLCLLISKKRRLYYVQGYWAQELIVYVCIGPKVQAEDQRPFGKGETLAREPMLVNDKVSFGHNGIRKQAEDRCNLR